MSPHSPTGSRLDLLRGEFARASASREVDAPIDAQRQRRALVSRGEDLRANAQDDPPRRARSTSADTTSARPGLPARPPHSSASRSRKYRRSSALTSGFACGRAMSAAASTARSTMANAGAWCGRAGRAPPRQRRQQRIGERLRRERLRQRGEASPMAQRAVGQLLHQRMAAGRRVVGDGRKRGRQRRALEHLAHRHRGRRCCSLVHSVGQRRAGVSAHPRPAANARRAHAPARRAGCTAPAPQAQSHASPSPQATSIAVGVRRRRRSRARRAPRRRRRAPPPRPSPRRPPSARNAPGTGSNARIGAVDRDRRLASSRAPRRRARFCAA